MFISCFAEENSQLNRKQQDISAHKTKISRREAEGQSSAPCFLFFHHVFMPHYQFLICVNPFRHSRRPNNITQKIFGDFQIHMRIHKASFFYRASGSILVFTLRSKFWRNRIQILLQDVEMRKFPLESHDCLLKTKNLVLNLLYYEMLCSEGVM